MTLRPRREWGTLSLEPTTYGRSVLGIPLHVWRSAGQCRLLVFAGIHGEEAETTVALSRALRHLAEPSRHCTAVLAANPDGLLRGTRGNANGVDLNRNFPTEDWSAEPVMHRSTLEDPRDVALSPGAAPGSEPETLALIRLVGELQPETVVALHAPLGCVDDPTRSTLSQRIAERTRLPLVDDVGYATPGSFGTWGAEHGLTVITYEFPLATMDALVREHVPVLVELLTGDGPR